MLAKIDFQEGPIKEVGINGVDEECLLMAIIERYNAFQKTPYACRENAIVITKLEEALLWMKKRTIDRAIRKIEGTSNV